MPQQTHRNLQKEILTSKKRKVVIKHSKNLTLIQAKGV